MTLDEFNRRFVYERKGIPGVFRDARKTLRGQRQDYAWTALIIETGSKAAAWKAMLTGKAVIWRVYSPSNTWFPRHVALHTERGWIDSTVRQFRSGPTPHVKCWPVWCEAAAIVAALAWGARDWGLW